LFPDSKIAEIRERADIAEIIGEYVTLRRAGSNLKGVCPFHADSDPSFNVNPARQFFHCFGCGASGDVFSFVSRIEGIDFTESLRRLAGRYGVSLPTPKVSEKSRTQAEQANQARKRRFFILEQAARFYEERLKTPQGAIAREALQARGVDDDTAARFRLGYAPDAWSGLIDFFSRQQVSPRELEAVGLALPRKSGNGYYDRFRNRLMFTVTDPSGRPIAFSGRALSREEAERGAKYINSPETEEYKKGHVLYGLHQARVPLSKSGEAIIVEGNFDVVSLSGVGIENVVAPLGTALTQEQAMLLRRRVERVVVLFDGDDAGRKAAARAFPVLAKAAIASYTAALPANEDPDSLVRRQGREGVLKIIADTVTACDGSAQDKARRIEKLKPFVDALPSMVEKDLYRGRIAEAFGVGEQIVFRALGGSWRPMGDVPPDRTRKAPPGKSEERELIGLLLDFPNLFEKVQAEGTLHLFSTPSLKRIAERMATLSGSQEASVAELIDAADDSAVGTWLAERAMVCLYDDKEKALRALDEIGSKLTRKPIKDQIKELDQQIRLASSNGDDTRVLELSRKKADLQGLC
jgi:DNA primase